MGGKVEALKNIRYKGRRYKRGEIFFLEDLASLEDQVRPIPEDTDYTKNTVKELHAILNQKGLEYTTDMKKSELVELLEG